MNGVQVTWTDKRGPLSMGANFCASESAMRTTPQFSREFLGRKGDSRTAPRAPTGALAERVGMPPGNYVAASSFSRRLSAIIIVRRLRTSA